MGDEDKGVTPAVWLKGDNHPLATDGLTYQDVVEQIGQRACIDEKDKDKLYKLAEDLIELSVIDQAHYLEEVDRSSARKRARLLASRIKSKADQVLSLLESISADSTQFSEVTGWSPSLLEEVFDGINNTRFGISIFSIPPQIRCIELAVMSDDWMAGARSAVQPFASLPLKESVSPTMRNRPLWKAMLYCREYWTLIERDWEIYTLRSKADRTCIGDLKGDCESFVANMLSACGFEFTLTELNSMWSDVGRAV